MKKLVLYICTLLFVFTFSACSAQEEPKSETSTSPVNTIQISNDLLKNITLDLPVNITRDDISDSRAYFHADDAVIGGIEILDIAGQRDSLPLADEYTQLAVTVTGLVYNGEYDRSVDNDSALADLSVEIKFQDGLAFHHYFFFGENVVYDIWVNHDVLDSQDMISILKTLHSEDIINPQDSSPANSDTPILNLRMDLPNGIQRMPATTTRLLFYNIPSLDQYVTGKNVAGGVEYIADATDLDTLESLLSALGQEYMASEFDATAQELSGSVMIAKITATSPETELISYVVQLDTEIYAVWASTTILNEEILKIAQSCSY